MAAGNWTLTAAGRTALLNGTFDVDSDTFKMALLTSSSNIGSGSTTFAGVTGQVANGNGYTTGGVSVVLSLSGTTTVTVAVPDAAWTASGASLTARWACIYEVSGNVFAYCLLDSTPADVTVTDTNTLTVVGGTVFTLA